MNNTHPRGPKYLSGKPPTLILILQTKLNYSVGNKLIFSLPVLNQVFCDAE